MKNHSLALSLFELMLESIKERLSPLHNFYIFQNLLLVPPKNFYIFLYFRYVLPCVGLTVSSYYLLHKLYTSYCLSKYKKDLNALITVVKNYSNLIHKNIQFIRDFESLSKIHSVRGPATALLNGKSNKVGMDFFSFFFLHKK